MPRCACAPSGGKPSSPACPKQRRRVSNTVTQQCSPCSAVTRLGTALHCGRHASWGGIDRRHQCCRTGSGSRMHALVAKLGWRPAAGFGQQTGVGGKKVGKRWLSPAPQTSMHSSTPRSFLGRDVPGCTGTALHKHMHRHLSCAGPCRVLLFDLAHLWRADTPNRVMQFCCEPNGRLSGFAPGYVLGRMTGDIHAVEGSLVKPAQRSLIWGIFITCVYDVMQHAHLIRR